MVDAGPEEPTRPRPGESLGELTRRVERLEQRSIVHRAWVVMLALSLAFLVFVYAIVVFFLVRVRP